jgi:hypothetical protein
MKTKLFFLFILITLGLQSQQITFSDKFEQKDIDEAFDMMGIKVFKYQMPEELKGHYFDLIIKEYYEGVEVSSVSYSKKFESKKQVMLWDTTFGAYIMKFQTLKNDSVERFNTRLPGMGIRGYGLKTKLKRAEYDWQSLFYKDKKIELDKEIPLLALATNPENDKRPNLAVFCELEKYSYKDWYQKLKVKHYFVILTRVTKN